MKTTRLCSVLLMISIASWSGGCKTPVHVIPADKVVIPLRQNENFTSPGPGYFVPVARMKEILDRLAEKEVFE